MNSLGFEPMTCLSFRNNTAQLHKVKLFTTCSWSQDTMPQSLKINDFLCFVATEHCMCWRPLYGSGLMWDFWLMFNRQPVSNCRAMTHREPAGYRTNTHTQTQAKLWFAIAHYCPAPDCVWELPHKQNSNLWPPCLSRHQQIILEI